MKAALPGQLARGPALNCVNYLMVEALIAHTHCFSVFKRENSSKIIDLLIGAGGNLSLPLHEIEGEQNDLINITKRRLSSHLFSQLKIEDSLILTLIPTYHINQANIETILALRQAITEEQTPPADFKTKLIIYVNNWMNLAAPLSSDKIEAKDDFLAKFKSNLARLENILQGSNKLKLKIACQQLYKWHESSPEILPIAEQIEDCWQDLAENIAELSCSLNPDPIQDFYHFTKENWSWKQINLSGGESRNIFQILYDQKQAQLASYLPVPIEEGPIFKTGDGGNSENITDPYIRSLYDAFHAAYYLYLQQHQLSEINYSVDITTELDRYFFEFFSKIPIRDIDNYITEHTYLIGTIDELE